MLRRLALPFAIAAQLLHAAQDPRFVVSRYGPEHGLSNRHVLSLVQDRVGFIFAGTVSGLDRFDGHGFRNWSVADGLSQGRVDQLRRDAQGRIWAIATDNDEDVIAIDVLDPAQGRLMPLADRYGPLPFDPSTVKRIAPQRDDEVIVLGAAGPAQCIRFDGTRFLVHRLSGERFDPLGHDRAGHVIGCLLSGSEQSIVRVGADGSVHTAFRLPPGSKVEALVTGRTSVGAQYRCVAGDGSALYYDTYSEVASTGLPLPAARSAGVDPVHRPLNVTPLLAHGMQMVDARILDGSGAELFDLTSRYPEVKQRVKACWVDRAGDPWLGTEFGLYRLDVRGDRFTRMVHDQEAVGGVGVLCRGMNWHDGRLYMASEWHGAFSIDPTNGTSVPLEGSPYLFGLHVSEDGTVWRGGRGTVEWNKPGDPVRSIPVNDNIWSLLRLEGDAVFLGGLKGLWRLDPIRSTVVKVQDAAHPELDQAHILQLRRMDDGRIEAVGSKGIYRLDAAGRVLQRLWAGSSGKDRLPFDDLHQAYTDREGLLWLSTRGAGLIRFDPRTGAHQQFAMRNGFPNNMVYAAYEDELEQLWLPTDGGIVRFDKQSRQSTVFTADDGLTSDEFNRLAHAQAPDGRLFFGGLNGITGFRPAEFRIADGETRFPLVLTSLQHYDAEQAAFVDADQGTRAESEMRLNARQRSVRIGFALLSFEGTGRITYAWRIEGLSSEWAYQEEPYIRLDRLPAGDHLLQVKARDANGHWTQQQLQVTISVDVPLLESRIAWATGGAACAALAALPFLFAKRRRRVARAPMSAWS